LFAHIGKWKFKSEEGQQLQMECENASNALNKLFRASSLTDQRNGMLGSIMNGFFMFDLWCIYRIESWRKEHKDHFPGWINSLIKIDTISSFANFAFNHPDFCDASIEGGKNFISARAMGHPLMNSAISVKNDYDIGVASRIHVVTGSNMAGKSTFIRAVGVNLILAKNGVPVCAQEFKCSLPGLITSIRISDSLEENASYFKAELIRLEQILEQLKTGQPFLVLLDEILRGTNSDDKRLGTQSFLLKLKQFNCLVMLATHDLNIGKLEQQFPGDVENYCFESQFTNEGLSFDYKLRKGISSSTNATFLMKRMGLID
jgi:DNA mismatch repair ATPase MutS